MYFPFKWDKAYEFSPGTSREKIYNTVGYKVLNITESDDISQLVIMNGKEVVYYSGWNDELLSNNWNFNESDFNNGVLTITPKKNDYLKVGVGENDPMTNIPKTELSYVEK